MIKFLLYLFLFYVLFRLVFGRLMGGGTVKTKVYRFDTHHHHYTNTTQQQQQHQQEEGRITINPAIKKEKKNPNDKNLGEYVDYEEIK